MPVDLGVGWFDPADDDLHGLSGQRLKLLRQLKDLMVFHLLLLPYVDKPNEDAEEQSVASVGDGEDLHPAGGVTGVQENQPELLFNEPNRQVRPVEDIVLLHGVKTSLQHLCGSWFLISIVRRHFRCQSIETPVLFPDDTTIEDRRRLDVKRNNLRHNTGPNSPQ